MIPDEIKKFMKWGPYPEETFKGGQHCGIINAGSTLTCEEMGFSISCDGSRSQLKNKNFCVTVFELYLEEFKICKTS